MSTIATLTEGQAFVITEPGHKFEGRTLTVRKIGETGRTLMATDAIKGNQVVLARNDASVEVR